MYGNSPTGTEGEPLPKKAKNQCPLPSGPSPERLLAHANALINKVSSFVTKPVNAKYGNKGMATTHDRPNQNVETPSAPMDPPLPVETEATTTHDKPTRTIRYKICKESFFSIKELNDHHQADHGVVDCEQCGKHFSTHTALDKHMYSHSKLRFVCEDCEQSFPFKSRLEQHKITHQVEPSFKCHHMGCEYFFKNKGGLQQTSTYPRRRLLHM